MKALAAIHIAKKQLGLDDETYRAVLVRVTGKASSKDMSEAERGKVLEEFRRLGFVDKPGLRDRPLSAAQAERWRRVAREPRRKLEGRYAGKLQALWIAAWNLGITRSRDDAALIAFVRRQTGIDHVRFVRDAAEAARAIEALKAWMAREARVDWSFGKHMPASAIQPGLRIALAQFDTLKRGDPSFARYNSLAHWMGETWTEWSPVALYQADMTAGDWHVVMNALGEKVRAMKGAA